MCPDIKYLNIEFELTKYLSLLHDELYLNSKKLINQLIAVKEVTENVYCGQIDNVKIDQHAWFYQYCISIYLYIALLQETEDDTYTLIISLTCWESK